MRRQELMQELLEIVCLRNRLIQFLEQRLQVLFSRLLAVKTNLVMKPPSTLLQFVCGLVVVFGLGHPFARRGLHREPCPW
jgi:hypothetical protein